MALPVLVVLLFAGALASSPTQECTASDGDTCAMEDHTSFLQVQQRIDHRELLSFRAQTSFNPSDLKAKEKMKDGIGSPVGVTSSDGSAVELPEKASIKKSGDEWTISKDSSGDGTWLPYVADHTTVAWAQSGDKWIGSGPYSGCHFGVFEKGNKIGIAHIPKPNVGDSDDEWAKFKKGVNVLNEFKVPMPDLDRYSASYVFVTEPNGPATPETWRVDVHAATMGGGNGPIYKVTKL